MAINAYLFLKLNGSDVKGSPTLDPLVVTWDGKSTTMDTDTGDGKLGDGSLQLLGTSDALAPSDFFLI